MVGFLVATPESTEQALLLTKVVRAIKAQVDESQVFVISPASTMFVFEHNPNVKLVMSTNSKLTDILSKLENEEIHYLINFTTIRYINRIGRKLGLIPFAPYHLSVFNRLFKKSYIKRITTTDYTKEAFECLEVFDVTDDNQNPELYLPQAQQEPNLAMLPFAVDVKRM